MKSILKRKKTLAVAIVLAIVVLPYAWSRICSPVHRVQAFGEGETTATLGSSQSLRVVSYNIAHGRGLAKSNWDGGDEQEQMSRLDEIAGLLKTMNADVVVLNEVDFDTSWSNGLNQAAYIAQKAGYPFRVEQRNFDFRVLHRTWRFGNAILSRHKISNAEVIDLPEFSTWENWMVGKKRGVKCDVNVAGSDLRIIGLHLSHRSEKIRNRSAMHVVELVRSSKIPCVVLGDMNSSPPGFPGSVRSNAGKNAIETFDRSGVLLRNLPSDPIDSAELTFPSDRPTTIIDWIFASKSLEIADYSVEPSTLSDHRPVLAVIKPASSPKTVDSEAVEAEN